MPKMKDWTGNSRSAHATLGARISDEKLTSVKAAQLLDEWRERIGLQEWSITLSINRRPEDFTLEGSLGEAHIVESIKCAEILIISPELCGECIVPAPLQRRLWSSGR